MECSLYNEIVSSINITDNTAEGLSHYANELNRLNVTAEVIKSR